MLMKAFSCKDASRAPLFKTPIEEPGRGLVSILGFPVTLAAAAPSVNAAGQRVIAFGDPRAQVVGIRLAFQFEDSGHFHWNQFQRTYRGIGRARTETRDNTGFAIIQTAQQ